MFNFLRALPPILLILASRNIITSTLYVNYFPIFPHKHEIWVHIRWDYLRAITWAKHYSWSIKANHFGIEYLLQALNDMHFSTLSTINWLYFIQNILSQLLMWMDLLLNVERNFSTHKHLEEFPHLFGRHLINMNIPRWKKKDILPTTP